MSEEDKMWTGIANKPPSLLNKLFRYGRQRRMCIYTFIKIAIKPLQKAVTYV